MVRQFLIVFLAALFGTALPARAALVQADFMGGFTYPYAGPYAGPYPGTPTVQSFNGPADDAVLGTLVFDDALVTPYGDVALELYSLKIYAGAELSQNLTGEDSYATIKFHDGIFNGIYYDGYYSTAEKIYSLDMAGSTWSLTTAITPCEGPAGWQDWWCAQGTSGYITVGEYGLTNISPYDADWDVSLPASLSLMALGLICLGLARLQIKLQRQTKVFRDSSGRAP